jgi:hypothetical protein
VPVPPTPSTEPGASPLVPGDAQPVEPFGQACGRVEVEHGEPGKGVEFVWSHRAADPPDQCGDRVGVAAEEDGLA